MAPALVLWFVLVLSTALGLFQRIENRVIDQAMRLRPEEPRDQAIVTIDIDDPSIATIGRWPWGWHTHRLLFDLLDRHHVHSIFVVDMDFSKAPPLSISPQEEEVIKRQAPSDYSKSIQEILKQRDPQGFILQRAFMKEKVFFTATSKIVDARDKGAVKGQGEDEYAPRPIEGQSFFWSPLIIPPLKDLLENSAGFGVNAFMPDTDGVVRRYPLFLEHRGQLYPSISLKAAMARLQAHRVDIKRGKVELVLKDRLLAIPIDSHGQMRVNWTGRYGASFTHVPFNLLSPFMLIQSLKEALQRVNLGQLQDPNVVLDMLQGHANTLALMNRQDSEVRATLMFVAFLMEYYFKEAGYGIEETLSALGLDRGNKGFLAIANQVYLNNKVMEVFNKEGKILSLQEALDMYRIQEADLNGLQDSYQQMVSYIHHGGDMSSIRPLYFEPSKTLLSESGERVINPWIFKDKVVFYGLTATGLTAQNPSPYMQRHPMLDLAPQVANTIVTARFIKELPPLVSLALITLYLIVVYLTALKARPVVGLIIVILLVAIHLHVSWLLFSKHVIVVIVTAALTTISVSYLTGVFIRYLKEYQDRRRVRKIFSTMVSPEVLRIMEGRPNAIALTGEIRDTTILSSDVSGFTNISEGVTAQELAQILNLYLTAMSNIIMSYDGYIDKYEGDAIKALFGVPLPDDGHPWKACWAALAQQEELKIIQKMILLRYGVKITARIGINTGLVYAGNMGSERRVQYTVMGEAAHIAEELEPANKLFDTWIAAGEETVRRCEGLVNWRFLGEFESSDGKPLKAYEVISWDRDGYIKYWQDRPVPELILEAYKRLTPLRALALVDYATHKTLDNPLLKHILDSLEEIRPQAMQYMKLETLLLFRDMLRKMSALQSLYKSPSQMPTPESLESSDRPENRLLTLSISLDRIEEYIKLQSLDPAILEEALLEIDVLRKTLESFRKRISIETANDSIAEELRDYITQMIMDKDILNLEEDHHNLQTMSAIESSIKNQGAQIAKHIKERPEEFYSLSALLITL